MFNLKKIKPILAIFSLFLLISIVQETYGKYTSDSTGQAQIGIARWLIKINNQDIITNEYITNVINPTLIGNTNVKDGVIAPRSQGYFDLVLDYTDVDVSFEYNLNAGVSIDSGVSDLKITGYSENGGTVIPASGGLNNITQTINVSNPDRVKTIRIYLIWEDSLTENMDNASDTMAAINQDTAILNVSITFTQVT